jgi:hypothetical protein
MSFVRDSYQSRDYHKGTGSRVFLTENPGRYSWTADGVYTAKTAYRI